MSDITYNSRHVQTIQQPPVRPSLPDMQTTRHANTLAEIQQMSAEYRGLQIRVSEHERTIDQLNNKIDLLNSALTDSRNGEKVYRRKLIRLAAAMEMMVRLGHDAEAIMKDAREINEVAAENEAKGEG